MALLLHAVHRLGLGVTILLVVLLWVGLGWGAVQLLRVRDRGSESGQA